MLFGVGLASLAVALMPPLETLAAESLAAHMVQHLVLIVVAPPVLVRSRAFAALLGALPRRATRPLRRVRRLRLPALYSVPTFAAVHAVVVWLWHAPPLYDAAVRHHGLHVAEHVMLLGTALLAWGTLLHPSARRGPVVALAVLTLFALTLQGALLGALLTFAPEPLYAAYPDLGDQQAAGVLMWVPGGLAYLGVALHALLRRVALT